MQKKNKSKKKCTYTQEHGAAYQHTYAEPKQSARFSKNAEE